MMRGGVDIRNRLRLLPEDSDPPPALAKVLDCFFPLDFVMVLINFSTALIDFPTFDLTRGTFAREGTGFCLSAAE